MESDEDDELNTGETEDVQRSIVYNDGKLNDILDEVGTEIPSLDFDDDFDLQVSYFWNKWKTHLFGTIKLFPLLFVLCWVNLSIILRWTYSYKSRSVEINRNLSDLFTHKSVYTILQG